MTIFRINEPDNFAELLQEDIPDILAYRGSIAHGMHNPQPDSIDDVDLIGIKICPKEYYLGFQNWGSRGTKEIKQGRYDIVIYELKKIVSLLLKGNPNVLSLLWTNYQHKLLFSERTNWLFEHRSAFASKQVFSSFAGYASAQLKKMETQDPAELREYIGITNELKKRGVHPNHTGEYIDPPGDHENSWGQWSTDKLLIRLTSYHRKGYNLGYMGDKRKQNVLNHGYDSKNAAHCIRLLRMCVSFMNTGEIEVLRTTDREELLDIKNGKWTLEKIKEHAEELFQAARSAHDSSPLPNEPDSALVEKLLVVTLKESFN